MKGFLMTLQRRALQERNDQDVFKTADDRDEISLEKLDENWHSNPLIIMIITGMVCLGLCFIISIVYCCYRFLIWRKNMKVGEAGFIQDEDLHLQHTASMKPYEPEIVNLEKVAKDLRSREQRGFGKDKQDPSEIKVGTGNVQTRLERIKIGGVEEIDPNCCNEEIMHIIHVFQEKEKAQKYEKMNVYLKENDDYISRDSYPLTQNNEKDQCLMPNRVTTEIE